MAQQAIISSVSPATMPAGKVAVTPLEAVE